MRWLEGVQIAFFVYTIALFSVYAALVATASIRFWPKSQFKRVVGALGDGYAWPPVTVILPAYQEEAVIVHSARLCLALNYPDHKVVVVCDGSKDRTFEVLLEAFELVDVLPDLGDNPIPTQPIQRCLATTDGRLTVVYKANGGKGDALNVGINLAKTPFVCCVDADTLLAKDSLRHLALEALRHPDVLAVSGTIRLAHGVTFTREGFEVPDVPHDLLGVVQLMEYTRAFYISRAGLDPLFGIVLISGAFGLFSRHAIHEARGYSTATQGEDFELVVRLRHFADAAHKSYTITHAPAAMAWTEAPETLRMLRSQRVRWHRGLLQTLSMHRAGLVPRRGHLHTALGLYFYLIFEAAAPIVELSGYALLLLELLFVGLLHSSWWRALFVFVVGVSFVINAAILYAHQEEPYPIARTPSELMRLGLAVGYETFFLRLLSLGWRLQATWHVLRGKDKAWGAQVRRGFGGAGPSEIKARIDRSG
jgi:cellulose synthase/poly-beta-1,6-N-acetylglucosamine synthase-like glycosyltransferase